jgi:hypothetical protein
LDSDQPLITLLSGDILTVVQPCHLIAASGRSDP